MTAFSRPQVGGEASVLSPDLLIRREDVWQEISAVYLGLLSRYLW